MHDDTYHTVPIILTPKHPHIPIHLPPSITKTAEYIESHSVSRLIGAPPGYVGHEQGGQLTEAVRRKPYSVVLFDEVEKAHEEVFNVLLGVLDDGRLTDGKGRLVSFANTVIILTSNLGSELLLAAAEGSQGPTPQQLAAARQAVMGVVHRHFRPEFLNRLDDCVMFHPLTPAQLRHVAGLQVRVRVVSKYRGVFVVVQHTRTPIPGPSHRGASGQSQHQAAVYRCCP